MRQLHNTGHQVAKAVCQVGVVNYANAFGHNVGDQLLQALSQRLQRLVQLGIIAKVADDSWAVRHEYRLTDKGADLYHVPLAILTWGQRWLGAAESDTTLTHTPCGADLKVVLSCGVCAEPITHNTIALAGNH